MIRGCRVVAASDALPTLDKPQGVWYIGVGIEMHLCSEIHSTLRKRAVVNVHGRIYQVENDVSLAAFNAA